jgi:aspartate/methionine/tyrosine aminotransferase
VALARSERTRGALLVSPNNPTGSYVKAAELEELAATGLPLVSDEVFAPYALKERRDAPSVLRAEAPLVFALSGLSKLAALPQMKLAWIVVGGSSDALVDEALARLEVLADAALSVGTPVQEALPELLASRHVVQRSIRARLEKNLASLQRIVKDTPVTVLDVEGGWYATLRLPGTETEEAWTLILLEEDAVYVHPGHFFDFVGEAYVVVSLLTREESFDEGVARIVRRVRAATARSTTMVTRN